MTNPYRALCAELVKLCAPVDSIPQLAERLQKLNALADRARAALAEPEPEPVRPTAEELLRVAASAIAPYKDCGIAVGQYEPEAEPAIQVYGSELIAYARAVLAKWGRPTPQPVAEGPTDEEIMELMPQQMRDGLAQAARAMIGFDSPKVIGACRVILNRHAVDHARAVLAKWGRQ